MACRAKHLGRIDNASRKTLDDGKVTMGEKMKKAFAVATGMIALIASAGQSLADGGPHGTVGDEVIAHQREALKAKTATVGAGPQSPRDIGNKTGSNRRKFGNAPVRQAMNLCNIHLHKNAEHRGGDFTTYAGNGDGTGNGTGYRYDGKLTKAELAPFMAAPDASEHGNIATGDTIEIHFVYSGADVSPGATLAACTSEAITNPQLRVETIVAVLVNDHAAADFVQLAAVQMDNGYFQVPNLPENLGDPVNYAGSTTGPDYNEKASPFQVTWNVRPKVLKIDIKSVAAWLGKNPFNEEHAHGVRNLVLDPELLSPID
jgi:hypothetical protein